MYYKYYMLLCKINSYIINSIYLTFLIIYNKLYYNIFTIFISSNVVVGLR